jgi:thiol:disulfide interchange protein
MIKPLVVAALLLLAQTSQAPEPKFDPTRDAARDIDAAVAEARRAGKHVILDVGGEWCGWCHALDRYFREHPQILAVREKHYVWLKVNYSPENKNTAVLSRYPAIPGYPHFFVLDQQGKLLQSQGTAVLEKGPSYDDDKMTEFLLKWAPKGK